MIARRVSSDQSNDPLLTSSGQDTTFLGSTSRDRVSFPLYDGHGNTIATLARNGTGYSIANEKRYDVWGKVRSDSSVGSSGQVLNPTQKYCCNLGHKYDVTSGLTYMRARYYEAETGRFISEDPAHEGVNWFAYCTNNPVGLIDDSGCNSTTDLYVSLGTLYFFVAAAISTFTFKMTKVINATILALCALSVASFAKAFASAGNLGDWYEKINETSWAVLVITSECQNLQMAKYLPGQGQAMVAWSGAYAMMILAAIVAIDCYDDPSSN